LKTTGCLFITSAVESFDERILTIFDKHHTAAEFEQALRLCDDASLLLVPTFVAFTPWITLNGYRYFLSEIARLNLVERVAPIQYAIRLLIPPGSRLLELPQVQTIVGDLDPARLSYVWHNPDPRVDQLQQDLERLAQTAQARNLSRRDIFRRVWARAHQDERNQLPSLPTLPTLYSPTAPTPFMTEAWYC